MTKLVMAHKNTDTIEIDLGELKNDKVAWIVLLKDDGSLQHFFPNEQVMDIVSKCIDCKELFITHTKDRNNRCQSCEQKFVDDTMKLVDENPELEVALSKIGHGQGSGIIVSGDDEGGCGNKIAQEVHDYIEGHCPHTHKKCDHWKEIEDDVFSCTHPEDDNTICPLEKELK